MTRRNFTAQAIAGPLGGTQSQKSPKRKILVFDVNETLLDVRALEPHFERAFGSAAVLREWFSTLLLYSMTVTLNGSYAEFGEIGAAALDMTAQARGKPLAADDRKRILSSILTLPPHPEVKESLGQLQKAGFRMVTLTNSAPAALEAQFENAALTPFFERLFSVDAVRKFKPSPEPYRHVAGQLGVPTSGLLLVAAHAWDIAGALAAGCSAAFVQRPGKVLFPLAPRPEIVGPDLRDVAGQLVATQGG